MAWTHEPISRVFLLLSVSVSQDFHLFLGCSHSLPGYLCIVCVLDEEKKKMEEKEKGEGVRVW
jgi:hypothetical protein